MCGSRGAQSNVETQPVKKKIWVNTGLRVIALGSSVWPPLSQMEEVRVTLEIEKLFGPNVDPGFLYKNSAKKTFRIVQ